LMNRHENTMKRHEAVIDRPARIAATGVRRLMMAA